MVQRPGREGQWPEIRNYDLLFAALDNPEIGQKVARGNFLRIMPKAEITLPPDHAYQESRYIWHRLPNPERQATPEPASEARP